MLWKRFIRPLKKFYTTIWDNIEKLKSVLLTLLIALSIFLTYSLWTFTPNNNVLEDETTIETKIPDGKKEKLSNIIQPWQVIIHHDSKHYWSYSTDQDTVYNKLQSALLIGNDQIDYNERIQTEGIDITYPTGIPVSVLKETFKFSNDTPFKNYEGNVERLRVHNDDGQWKIQFIFEAEEIGEGTDEHRDPVVFQYEISDKSTNALIEMMVTSKNTVEVDEYEFEGNTFYLPIEKMNVDTYYYSTSEVDISLFVKALLPPGWAKRKTDNKVFYAEPKSQITYLQDSKELTYINRNSHDELPRQNAIIQSLDWINNHAGWTNTYHLYHYDDSSLNTDTDSHQKEISYRMIMNGLPIMDDSIGQISLKWMTNQASEYNRSLVYLREKIYTQDSSTTLAKGADVIQALSELSDANSVSDITIGYTLKLDLESDNPGIGNTLFLEPAWYYKNRSWTTWRKVDFESIEPIKNKGG
ncbi:YycH family regulatory protein [Pseudalkalibacillus salsuginis]|uniref:YycH family regulatory protein n=1 Tax=Pseudalkalibacillus salsuginis TaxID=2910972 RepID=UPI001F23D686|nr:two-component system activity regulator YycH [Pseudalkalibacillus salsuginis]MCF6410735.1 two-component system activity regulator YycH [Pseudalkalibacillus salsuginis]